jgi:hypothetical protein
VSLEAVNSSRLAQVLAPGPAEQGGELVPTSYPAPTPQTPLRTLQVARCSLGEGRLEAVGGLQCVLEPHGGVPPVEHRCGARQHLAPRPPQPGIAVAQHGRGRAYRHARYGERPPSSREPRA